jgi:hypothetical protein
MNLGLARFLGGQEFNEGPQVQPAVSRVERESVML